MEARASWTVISVSAQQLCLNERLFVLTRITLRGSFTIVSVWEITYDTPNKCLGRQLIRVGVLGFGRMCEHGDGDAEASSSASLRPSFAPSRAPPGRVSLNPPPPGRLTSLRSRDLTLGGYKKVALSNVNGSISNALNFV